MIKKRWGEKVNLSVYLYWFTDVISGQVKMLVVCKGRYIVDNIFVIIVIPKPSLRRILLIFSEQSINIFLITMWYIVTR